MLHDGTAENSELLLLLKRPLSECFQAVAGDKISQPKKPYVPDNTWHSTDWAVRTFEQWRDFYNSKQNESECPRNILMTEDKEVLCHWLCIGSEKGEWRPIHTMKHSAADIRSKS